MPNWCQNQLTVSGPPAEVQRFTEKAVGHSPWLRPEEVGREGPDPLNFHSLCPVPEALVKEGYSEAAYDWELENWGCKWGAREVQLLDELNGRVLYAFDTAWAPPMEFIEHVSKEWPLLAFELAYEEGGMCFKGIAKAQAGQLDDQCVTF